MKPASLAPTTPPGTPGTPGTRTKQGHAKPPHDVGPDFTTALALLLGGNVPGNPQALSATAEEQGAPAPSAGVTDVGPASATSPRSDVSVLGNGPLTAALSGAQDASVVVSGAAAPFTPIVGAAAPGRPIAPEDVKDDTGTTLRSATPPAAPAFAGEPVAAGLHGLTPVSARADAKDLHAASIARLPETARPAETAPTTPEPSTFLPLAAAPASVTTTTAGTPDSAVTTTVLRQVFPEITQVASTPGTHRISITLHPESLGEVRVTVVVRAGGVHVRLAADASAVDGMQARQALLQGAPELHRLLEGTGGDVRVVVQGAPSGAPGGTPGSSDQNPAQQSQSQSPGQGYAQAQSQAGDGQRRPSYTPDNPQVLPLGADQTIGATTTTIAPDGAVAPGRVAQHAGRLDRLM